MKFKFTNPLLPEGVKPADWYSWQWQMRNAFKTKDDFLRYFNLNESEIAGFDEGMQFFSVRTNPYYASLASKENPLDPIRMILMPNKQELFKGWQQMNDPLAELKNNPTARIIHRYSDRVLFLVTDTCSVYCRYCTRKYFTASDQSLVNKADLDQALNYLRRHVGIREVILSGGDPLTLSDEALDRILKQIREIEHIEIIRIGSRMPVVNPMRITEDLLRVLKKYKPIYLMTHFNHPKEISQIAAEKLELLVDSGVPVFNQMVLLNGINNHPAIVQALSRRLLYLRVKPYYMFQCDPSEGSDHLRTSIEDSLEIQKELWGHLSGLAMPNLALDIPNGGGKAALVPNFEVQQNTSMNQKNSRQFKGWDGVEAEYINPLASEIKKPIDAEDYLAEWHELKQAKLELKQEEKPIS